VVTTAHGSVVWVDLSTPDLDAAIHFYERLFDWHYEEHESEMGTYVTARVEGGDVCGMMGQAPEQAGMPPVWTVFVGCDHLENMLARVRELGGSVIEAPLSIPGGARIAVVADPTGAVLALAEGSLAARTIVRDEPGAPGWVECQSRDVAESRDFYEGLFGWKAEEGTRGYLVFTRNDEQICGLMVIPDEAPAEVPSHWMVYFVADVAQAVEQAPGLGGTVEHPTHDTDEGRFAVLADPAGAVFAVFEEISSG
jgi:uncharacterized protein